MSQATNRKPTFCLCKQSLDGNHLQWGHMRGLSDDQVRDLNQFPAGKLRETDGREFVWTYFAELDGK